MSAEVAAGRGHPCRSDQATDSGRDTTSPSLASRSAPNDDSAYAPPPSMPVPISAYLAESSFDRSLPPRPLPCLPHFGRIWRNHHLIERSPAGRAGVNEGTADKTVTGVVEVIG